MALNNNIYHQSNIDEEEHEHQKFSFTECPFVPNNNLSRKNFIDDHTYKYYNINFTDEICSSKKHNNFNINFNNEKNITQRDKNNKNILQIYHNKRNNNDYNNRIYDTEKEINTKTGSDDFVNKTHECGEKNLINHGRGKEKNLNPRKILHDVIKNKIQEDGNNLLEKNKDPLNREKKRCKVSKENGISLAEEIKNASSFGNHDENEFLLSAKITIITDIPLQTQCKHEISQQNVKLNDLKDCKHEGKDEIHLITVDKIKTNNVCSDTNNNVSDAIMTLENEHLKTFEKKNKTLETLPIETQVINNFFNSENQKILKINDIYEEEQFEYDPESKKVSHLTLTRSRSENFLEYFNQLNDPLLTCKSNMLPQSKLEISTNSTREVIYNSNSEPEYVTESNKEKKIMPQNSTLNNTETSHKIQNCTNKDINLKKSLVNNNLLIIENKKKLENPKSLSTESSYIEKVLHINSPNASNEVEKDTEKPKTINLPCINKRPELQKRYFYNAFKIYKKVKSDDDIPFSDQVKVAKDKFEKIFYDLTIKHRTQILNDPSPKKLELLQSNPSNFKENIKDSQRFVSEDNICLLGQNFRDSSKPTHTRRNSIIGVNHSQPDKQLVRGLLVRNNTLNPTKHFVQLSRSNSSDQLVRIKQRTFSTDNLCPDKSGHSMRLSKRVLNQHKVIPEDGSRINQIKLNLNNIKTCEKSDKLKVENVECNIKLKKESLQKNVINEKLIPRKTDAIENNYKGHESKVIEGLQDKIKEFDSLNSIPLNEMHKLLSNSKSINRFLPNKKENSSKISKNSNSTYNTLKSEEGWTKVEDCIKTSNIKTLPQKNIVSDSTEYLEKISNNRLHTLNKSNNDSKETAIENLSQNDNENNISEIEETSVTDHDSDSLETFGRPISEEMLSKIRACGTSVTYFGGKVISRKYGPMCSPMTMTILNEIKQYMSILNEHIHKPSDKTRDI